MNTQEQQVSRYSARPAVLLGLTSIVVLVGGFFVWGMTSEIAGAVVANGEVTISTGNRPIEHLDGGAVAEVYVRNGDRVSGGDPLLRFAEASLQDDLATLELSHTALIAQRNRLEAEQGGSDIIEWDESLELAAADTAVEALVTDSQSLFNRRLANHRGQIAILESRIAQAEAEAAQMAAGKALEAKNLIAQMQAQILQIEAARSSEAEALLLAALPEEHDLRARIRNLAARIDRTTLYAPTDGTVFDLAVSGPGEVVFQGEPLLQIVPDNSALVVRTRISPRNIDQVHLGQEAIIRFTAFPYRSSPERMGRVVQVSADAFTDPSVGESWYEAELSIEPPPHADAADADPDYDDALVLVPGMPAEVQIRTDSRTVISYLFKPVTDFFNRSLRED